MFTCADPDAADAAISSASSTDVAAAARDHLRTSRQHEARSLLSAYRLGQSVYDDMLISLSATQQMTVRSAADKAAVGEISLVLGFSRTKAGTWFNLGDALQRLPKIRTAYLAGEFSTHRMSKMVYAAQLVPDDLVPDTDTGTDAEEPDLTDAADPAETDTTESESPESDLDDPVADNAADDTADDTADDAADPAPTPDFEDLALELESRPTTDKVFADQLAETVISLDPDGAAHARDEFAHAWQNLTVTADSSGHMNLDACVPAEDGVHLSQRISTLIAARLCRRDPRRIGQQRVMALAEITGVPGKTLTCQCGHDDCPNTPTPDPDLPNPSDPVGPIDLTDPSEHGTEGVSTAADVPEAESCSEPPPTSPTWTLVSDPTGIDVPRLRGYGAIDPTLAATLAEHATLITPPDNAHRRPSGLIVTGERGPAPPVDPTGHGGYLHPPPGALTYAPSRRLRDQILHTDLWCRYPMCGKPSHECELDHLVKYHHADPQAGGWTLPDNIIPLCRPDHHRKHLGIWLPTMHTDRTITWHNPTTGQEITTHPR